MVSSSPTESNPTRGRSRVERDRRVRGAHHGELHQVRRAASHARARVEQHRRRTSRRDDGRERGTVEARQQTECRMAGHHRRTRVSRAEERLRVPIADLFGRHANRRPRLAAQRRHGRLGHLDPLRRVHDLDVEASCRRMTRELGFNRHGVAHEEQTDLQVTRRHERAVDDRCRSRVVPHGVDGNAHRQMSGLGVQPQPELPASSRVPADS